MRVLHIISSMDPLSGGPCQGIRTSSPVLEALQVYREIVCFDPPTAAYLGTDPFPVHALGTSKNQWFYSPKLAPWLRENLHRFDVVVTNGLWSYHSQAVRKAVRQYNRMAKVKKPLQWFVMPHGMLDPYFQRAVDRKLKAIRNWFYWKFIEQHVISQADGILFTCETELLLARETFSPYRPQLELNVGYGIEAPPPFEQAMQDAFLARCPEVANTPFLLFLSRIHPKKGVDLLVNAYIELSQQLASSGMELPKLVIAGPGLDTAFGQLVQQLVQRHPAISANVFFPGMLSGAAKWGAFYTCDAFVLPSHQENFGIAVAEALACGTPTLISDQVNIWREIAAGGGGIVVPNTPAGTLHLLQQWITLTPAERKMLGRQARDTFEEHFTIRPAAERFKEAVSSKLPMLRPLKQAA
ncbi:glycosyltransferase [Fibrella aquatilis]|uniref:Glycosyltransferase n=1 Tax=Fibrella aquatilis TaxID=2817059 RepID=A0A939K1L5_9BACT|nr:glycosyltransferase [Fibrella aquatilis]MBO0933191.1 glycosyltransferase [Fibrella aquatilis]